MMQRRTLAVVGLAMCMFISSMSWMIMQVPDILLMMEMQHDMKWVLSIYIIAEVTVLPAAGKLTDVYGPRKVLTLGAAVFIAGALLCTLADGEPMLVAMRAVQGAGAGIAFAVVLATVGRMFPRSERGHPHEAMTAAFAFGSLYGAMVGYWFVEDSGLSFDLGWKATFYLEAAVMLAGLLVAMRGLPEQTESHRGRHDVVGTAFLMVLIADLMVLSQLVNDEIDIIGVETGIMLAIAAVSAVILWLVERGAEDPVIPRGLGRTKAGGMLCMFLAGFCGLGMVQFLMRFMLLGLGVDIYEASLSFIFLLAGGGLTSMVGLRRVNATGIRPWIMVGPIVVMVGFAVASQTLIMGIEWVWISLFILGMGLGCIVTEILCSIQGTTRVTDMGSVTAVTMSSRFIGILLGAAVYTAILDSQVEEEIVSIAGSVGDRGLMWLIENYGALYDEAVYVFESSVELCCLIAGILCVGILAVAFLLVGRDDVDVPEFIGRDGEALDPEEPQ